MKRDSYTSLPILYICRQRIIVSEKERKKERKKERERERKQEIKIKIKWNIGIILSERDYVVFDRGMNRNLARCWFAENQLSVHIQFPLTEVESDRYCIGISELPFG